MKEVPFKVSARAARLIGRENVATSQGAITELVKNSYDADASACAILFLKRYEEAPRLLSHTEYSEFSRIIKDLSLYYSKSKHDSKNEKEAPSTYELRNDLAENQALELAKQIENVLDLWIVDNGAGMSAEVIENQWMVIGTDIKEYTLKSGGGRILTGAKGIGRFALDRLGQECELYSSPKSTENVVHWIVDWGNFEGRGKVLNEVTATIQTSSGNLEEYIQNPQLYKNLPALSPENAKQSNALSFSNGTAICIRVLHDVWDIRDSIKLKETLEALLPPKDQGDFGIYVFDHRDTDKSGWIDNFPPDQFDYRMHSSVSSDGVVTITIDRKEIDVPKIRPSFFELPAMQTERYRKSDFQKGSVTYTKPISDIVSLEKWENVNDLLSIGPFEFTLYYFKLSNPTSENLKKFPQKSFDVAKRKRWLKNSGGIRLYRDEFRVRPYGEPNTQGSDWLLLGQRTAQNPAGVSRMGWRVPPQQVAGTIHISKARNPSLADQSNREGIMNERAFALFRKIILSLITEFEKDRSYIYFHLDQAYDNDNPDEGKLKVGKALADKILKEAEDSAVNTKDQPRLPGTDISPNDHTVPLAQALHISEEHNTALKDEIQVLRGMATLGTVLVSFTHELKQIQANMGSRQQRLKNAIERVIDPSKLEMQEERTRPQHILARWEREDEKVSKWVEFALSSVSPTKRRRKPVNWQNYLDQLNKYWMEFCSVRKIDFETPNNIPSNAAVLAHEIDLDSVFYNLIINSFEAFNIPSTESRKISIEFAPRSEQNTTLIYRDNGPGIPNTFSTSEDIFMFGTTSKRDAKNNETTGTGIGMWLIKSIIDDFGGELVLLSDIGQKGFQIQMSFPNYERSSLK